MPVRDLLSAASGASAPSDPYFEYNTLLLNGDGTNGAQNNTFLDSSTNNFTITRNGNTTQGSFSPYGSLWSNYFDGGTSTYLQIANNSAFNFSTNNFTIEVWLNPNSLSTNPFIWSKSTGNSASGGWFLELGSGGQIYFGYGTTVGSAYATFSGFPTTTNQWTHLAVTRVGSVLTAYINGVQQTPQTVSGAGSSYDNSANVQIGGWPIVGTSYQFNGYMSNLRVVNGTAVYTGNFTPSTTPLTAITNTSLLTCQSNRFIDNSSNAFAITVSGSPQVQRFSPFNPTAPYDTATIGGSGYFDGSGDYLSGSNNISGSGSFTYEAWVYLQAYPASGQGAGIISSDGTSNGWILRIQPSGAAIFSEAGFSNYFLSTDIVPLNAWTHVAAVRNGTTANLYINGVQQSNTGTFTNNYTSSTYVVGRTYTNSNAEYFTGYISNARVSQSAVYTATFTVPTAPLSATGASLLLSTTNAGIPDLAMMNDLETVGNAQVSTSVKKYGTGSLAFDGTGDYLRAPHNPNAVLGTSNWTAECWVYTTNLTNDNNVLSINEDGNTFASVRITIYANGSVRLLCSAGAGTWIDTTAGGSISTNTWYHIAAVRNGSNFNLYVNGSSVLSYTSSSSLYNPAGQSLVGALNSSTGFTSFFVGYIDDLRFTKGLARYTANFTPPTAALPTY